MGLFLWPCRAYPGNHARLIYAFDMKRPKSPSRSISPANCRPSQSLEQICGNPVYRLDLGMIAAAVKWPLCAVSNPTG